MVKDVRLGYVSKNAAISEYGVVIDFEGGIDSAATEEIRKRNSKIEVEP